MNIDLKNETWELNQEKLTPSKETTNISCLSDSIEHSTIETIAPELDRVSFPFGKNLVLSHSYKAGRALFQWIITFTIPPQYNPHQIIGWYFESSEITKISWGSTSYYGKNINKVFPKFPKKFVDYSSNSTACSLGEIIYKSHNFRPMDIKKYSASAVFICQQEGYFNWFWNNNSFYLQIAISQFIETWGTLVGGAMWFPLGNSFSLLFKKY